MNNSYPIILTPDSTGYAVGIPDFQICTQGDSIPEAMELARDAIGLMELKWKTTAKHCPSLLHWKVSLNVLGTLSHWWMWTSPSTAGRTICGRCAGMCPFPPGSTQQRKKRV